MKKRTTAKLHRAYVEEVKAHERLLVFAQKAIAEDLPQISHLFQAIAASESIQSRRHFSLLEISGGDTQMNLERAFQSETGVP